jgi:transposase
MSQQELYVGLDVSLQETSICVINDKGQALWRGVCRSDPAEIAAVLSDRAPGALRVGIETGPTSNWLTLELRKRGVPIVCMDARHAKAALQLQINKTDANDAFGLAQVVRTGWYREIAVKSLDAQALRSLLVARSQLVGYQHAIGNTVRGLLKGFGIVIPRGAKGRFPGLVRSAAADNATVMLVVEPLLAAWQALRDQAAIFDRQLHTRAKSDLVARRLMTVPGVGVVVALAYVAVIDDPTRFRHSEAVGAYLGLTPRRFQSGEVDVSGHISRRGDGLLRSYLYQAATVILARSSRPSQLKRWGQALAKRIGTCRARVALARKLAVVLHRMWMDGTTFENTMASAA